ncbi:MAG TPA: hypothetical protein PKX28_10645, partial [Candidatus Hydrogenedentes bacterium]|nr:hypothetical protein [Candidatus Hydrogenedentota bacterium]
SITHHTMMLNFRFNGMKTLLFSSLSGYVTHRSISRRLGISVPISGRIMARHAFAWSEKNHNRPIFRKARYGSFLAHPVVACRP